VLLHDIGKTRELTYDTSLGYSDCGGLVGHLSIGLLLLEEKLKEVPDFPPERADLVRHLVLSHHGELEWGSPVRPAVPEAIALHYIDNLDAKLTGARTAITADAPDGGTWTEFLRMFDRRLYRGPSEG